MNRTGIEKALQNAVSSSPEIPFEQIAAQPFIRMQEHDYITRQEVIKKTSPIRQFTLAAAFCMVILLTISGWYFTNKVPDSIIMLDVNPSIEILTNRKNEVLAVKALNEDAKRLIGDNDYSKTELDDTITRLLTSLVENSYINQDKNTILLSVTNRNNRKADHILRQMGEAIKNNLEAQNIQPIILSRIISRKEGSSKLADQYNISRGKLLLIQDMIAFNSDLTLDKLAGLPVEQLLKLARENHMDLSKYLALAGEAGIPSVTAAPDKNPEATRDGAAKDGIGEDSKLGDDSDSEKEDTLEQNEDEDQEIEDRNDNDKNDEDKNEEGEKNYSKSEKGKNRQKEDADSEKSDDRSANTGEAEAGSDEDNSYSSGEGDASDDRGSQWSEEDGEADGQEHYDYDNQDGYLNDEEGVDGNSANVGIDGSEEDNESIDTWGDNGYNNESGSYEDNAEKNLQEDDGED